MFGKENELEQRSELSQEKPEILQDLATYGSQSEETLQQVMKARYGKNWEKKAEKARKQIKKRGK